MQKNHYSILGLKPETTLSEIKKAYRRLAFRYHPDQNREGNFSEERFREIREAYEVLSDPVKRKHFDAAMRARNAFAPHYAFSKYGMPLDPLKEKPAGEEKPLSKEEARRQRKSNRLQWLKPLIFIVVAVLLMWLIMNPPEWLSRFLQSK